MFKTKVAAEQWGHLATLPRNDALLPNMSRLLAAQRPGSRFSVSLNQGGGGQVQVPGRSLYLHDASLRYHCPALMEKMKAPRYFPVD